MCITIQKIELEYLICVFCTHMYTHTHIHAELHAYAV